LYFLEEQRRTKHDACSIVFSGCCISTVFEFDVLNTSREADTRAKRVAGCCNPVIAGVIACTGDFILGLGVADTVRNSA